MQAASPYEQPEVRPWRERDDPDPLVCHGAVYALGESGLAELRPSRRWTRSL